MLLAIGVAAFVLAGLTWRLTGGNWQIVATPSMGQAAPVGTLVFTREATTAQVSIGDIISFRPPTATSQVHTHRVVRKDADGTLHTRGDINGSEDPWPLHNADLVGVVVARWWGMGWLLKALPLLIVGGAVLWFATRLWASRRWRNPLRVFGFSLLFSIAAYLLKPFVGFTLIVTTATENGTSAGIVSTGLLPIRVSASTGGHVDLIDGQVGELVTRPGTSGANLTSLPHLGLSWWLVLIAVWLTPLCWGLLLKPIPVDAITEPPDDPPGADPAAPAGVEESAEPAAAWPFPWTAPPGDDSGPAAAPTNSGRTETAVRPSPTGRHAHRAPARHRAPVRHRALDSRPQLRRWIAVLAVAAVAVVAGHSSTAAAFVGRVTNSTNTVTAAAYFTCAAAVASAGSGAYFVWPLTDSSVASGATAADSTGNGRTGLYTAGFTTSPSKACNRDGGGSVIAGGTTPSIGSSNALTALAVNPSVFSEEIWFKTGVGGGRLIGFGAAQTGTSLQYDRHLYLANNGQIIFGVYPNQVKTIVSPLSYSNNLWHHAVATLSGAGMALYVDGALVASDTGTTTAQIYTGYWRVGYDSLSGWTNQPTNFYFNGNIAWAAVYTVPLTAAQVKAHYIAGA